jgi:hypothetical protein
MRRSFFIPLLVFSAAALAQQPQQQQPQQQDQQLDKDSQTRIRAEHSAGGLGKITDEEKKGATLGAGPHKERLGGAANREPRSDPAKKDDSARGDTR